MTHLAQLWVIAKRELKIGLVVYPLAALIGAIVAIIVGYITLH